MGEGRIGANREGRGRAGAAVSAGSRSPRCAAAERSVRFDPARGQGWATGEEQRLSSCRVALVGQVVDEIRERLTFLEEMRALGQVRSERACTAAAHPS